MLEDSGILYQISELNDGDLVKTARKVVPHALRKLTVLQYHDSLWAGSHMGVKKTFEKIRTRFYFPKMWPYVEAYVNSCPVCQRIKDPHYSKVAKVPLQTIDCHRPWDLLCVDLWGPLTRSRSGNKYCMTVVDGFSKWAMAIALPSKKQEIVAEALVSRVFIMGWPDRLLTDRGKEFTNRVLNQCLKLCGSRHVTTTAYHPQGNAYAERIHRFFRHAVTAYVRDDQRN